MYILNQSGWNTSRTLTQGFQGREEKVVQQVNKQEHELEAECQIIELSSCECPKQPKKTKQQTEAIAKENTRVRCVYAFQVPSYWRSSTSTACAVTCSSQSLSSLLQQQPSQNLLESHEPSALLEQTSLLPYIQPANSRQKEQIKNKQKYNVARNEFCFTSTHVEENSTGEITS